MQLVLHAWRMIIGLCHIVDYGDMPCPRVFRVFFHLKYNLHGWQYALL